MRMVFSESISKKFIAAGAIIFMAYSNSYSQRGDADFSDDNGFGGKKKSAHEIKFFVEYEGAISTNTEQDAKDIFKKNEMRANLNYKFGSETFFAQTDANLYLLPGLISEEASPEWRYADKFKARRDLALESRHAEINFRELFVNYEAGAWRFRAGNQVFAWGTADVFNPTSYFNPYDLREFLFKDEDSELKRGVPSASVLKTFGDDSLELVIVPIHSPSRMPLMNTFWGIEYKEGPFPVVFDEGRALDFGIDSAGAGIKYYKNIMGYDLHASLYRGPDREPAMRPARALIEPGKPVSILVVPEYEVLNMIGFAASKNFDKYVFQLEAVYSPDKTGIVEKDIASLGSSGIAGLLPYEKKKTHFVSYSAGLNYFVPVKEWYKSHEGECVLSAEWSQSHFFDDELMKPMLTDILVLQLRDKFFYGKLVPSVSGIFDTANNSYIFMLKVLYKFDSGVSAEISYVYISSEKGNYFSSYDDNDIFTWRVRYEFK